MTSIPLHCNICPKAPDFSDLSHLLTHVASKGHLSHYFKAQVRARKDEDVRQNLDRYGRWYDDHQIERLLSQRMISKETRDGSKDSSIPEKETTTLITKSTKPRRPRRTKPPATVKPTPSPLKDEDVIDPQLEPHRPNSKARWHIQESPSEEAALRHRTHVPRMLHESTETPCGLEVRSSSLPSYQRSILRTVGSREAHDTGSDHLHTLIRSPARLGYPEPPDISTFVLSTARRHTDTEEENHERNPSPVLKGIKYPGMSLFDSASQEAQRLRNQKKDGSVLEQMQLDASAIEPMEHIYWPEGGLKKKRLITGNVESSPVNEPTPPPKRARTGTRRVLAQVSTNAPKPGRKRGRKPNKVVEPSHTTIDGMAENALKTLKTAYPRSAHMRYDPRTLPNHQSHVPRASPNDRRKASFEVFQDRSHPSPGSSNELEQSNEVAQPSEGTRHAKVPPSQLWRTKSTASHPPNGTALARPKVAKNNIYRSETRRAEESIYNDDKENIPLVFSANEGADEGMEFTRPERVTQRYFSVVGNQQPQFFSSMPPQMEFGGIGGPHYYGTSLNPLNPFLGHHYSLPQYSPAAFMQHGPTSAPAQPRGVSACLSDKINSARKTE